MFKLSVLLCFSCLTIGSFASLVPFIHPCEEDDKVCLIKSSQDAVPFFADGGFLGLAPLDPIHISKPIVLNQGGLNLKFTDAVIAGAKKCQVVDVGFSIKGKWLTFASKCPIVVKGEYESSGKLLSTLEVAGNGPFSVIADEIFIKIKVQLDVVTGKDGEEHWQVSKPEHTYEITGPAKLDFQNLFNGDKDKAQPVNTMIQQNAKLLLETVGQGFVKEVIDHAFKHLQILTEKVPRNQLQKI